MQDLGFRAVGFMVRRGLLGYFGGTRYGTEGMFGALVTIGFRD